MHAINQSINQSINQTDWLTNPKNKRTNEQVKEKTNERTSKRAENKQMSTNERTNERTNEWANERTNERASERASERTNKRREQTNEHEWMNERTNERTREQTNKRREQTNKRMNERTNERTNEQTNEPEHKLPQVGDFYYITSVRCHVAVNFKGISRSRWINPVLAVSGWISALQNLFAGMAGYCRFGVPFYWKKERGVGKVLVHLNLIVVYLGEESSFQRTLLTFTFPGGKLDASRKLALTCVDLRVHLTRDLASFTIAVVALDRFAEAPYLNSRLSLFPYSPSHLRLLSCCNKL